MQVVPNQWYLNNAVVLILPLSETHTLLKVQAEWQ